MKTKITSKAKTSANSIFLLLLTSIFLTELVIMLLLPHIIPNNQGSLLKALIDATCLVLVLYPVIMIFVVRPLKNLQINCDSLVENESLILENFNDMASNADGFFFQLKLLSSGNYSLHFLNKQVQSIYRQTQEDLIRDPTQFFSVVHPEDIDEFQNAIKFSAKKLTMLSHQYRLKFQNGDECKLSVKALPQQQTDDAIVFNGFIKQIYENPELKLLRDLSCDLYSAQLGIVFTDSKNNIKQINQSFTTITGYRTEEVVGKNMRILSSKQHDVDFYEFIFHCVETQGSWVGELWNQRKNGEFYLQRTVIFPIKNEHGKTLNYIGVITDISHIVDKINELESFIFYQHMGSSLLH